VEILIGVILMAKDKPVTSGIKASSSGSSSAKPVVKVSTPATNLTTQKVKHDLLVDILGQTASTLSFTANVIPIERVDPRFHNGRELMKIMDGSVYSGTYLTTEVTTTYQQGRRDRTVSGFGHAIDGANPTKLVEDTTKGTAKKTLPSEKNKDSPTGGGSTSGTNGDNSNKNSSSSGGKPNSPSKQMYYKDGKWYYM
jgi:hypothetical protein